MSRDRTKRERLEKLIPDPFGAPDGQIMVTTKIDDRTYIYELATPSPGGSVDSVTGTAPINVDNTDPANPVVGHDTSGVTPGSYTSANITVDADGHVTAAADGSGGSSPLTTKGDLYGYSTVDARVPVGANNQFLVPDSAQALGLKYTDLRGGLSWRVGRKDGAVLLAGFQRVFILPAGYDSLATWELSVYPGATCAVDVQYRTFGSTQPGTGDSIVGGVYPATTGSVTATGTTASWTNTAPAIGAYIAIYVHANDLAREIIFQVAGRRIP